MTRASRVWMVPVNQGGDNARALAARVLDEVESALLDLIAAGPGQLLIEVRAASHDRRRVLVTRGTTTCVTVPVADLSAETFSRVERRRQSLVAADLPPTSPEPAPRRYLDTADVAKRYGVSEAAVRQRLRRGQLPPPIVLSRRRLWDERDLNAFDDAHKAPPRQRQK